MAVNKHIIDVKTKGAKKSAKQIKGVGSALGGMAKQAGIAAAAYFGGRALLNGVKQSIDLFAKQELAEKKLEVALGKTSNMLLNQARALQQSTMFGDEAIIEAQALIGSFVKEEEAIAAATKATLDLAAAKGMDLVVAADLVSKTLGSSTNALSRYGIQVVGAVGSTERLESLTGNLASVFGGQATEQSNTLAGALESMSNSIGDAQEAMGGVFAPVVENVAGLMKTAADNVSEFMKKASETRLETTIRELKELGVSGDALIRLENLQIDKALKSANEELKDLNINNSTTEQIEKRLIAIGKDKKTLVQEIGLIEAEDMGEKERMFQEDMNFTRERSAREKELMEDMNSTRQDFANQAIREKEALTALTKEFYDSSGESERERLDLLIEEELALANILAQEEKIDSLEKQKTINKKVDVDNTIKGEEKASKFKEKIDAVMLKNKGKVKEEILKHNELEKSGDIKEAFRNAWGIGQDAYKWGTKLGGPLLGAITGAAGLTAGLSYAKNISGFATGADYTTSGPELIMVGDNPSGQERVQVTPLGGDPNINGPQGSGITLNISGNVMSEEFTESMLLPQIKEALRLGGDLGV